MRLRRVVVARIKADPVGRAQFSMINEAGVQAPAGPAPSGGMPQWRNRQICRLNGTRDRRNSGCENEARQ
jgi:hypothetical protein